MRERGARAHSNVLGYGVEMEVDGGQIMMYEKRKVFVNQSGELLWNYKRELKDMRGEKPNGLPIE